MSVSARPPLVASRNDPQTGRDRASAGLRRGRTQQSRDDIRTLSFSPASSELASLSGRLFSRGGSRHGSQPPAQEPAVV